MSTGELPLDPAALTGLIASLAGELLGNPPSAAAPAIAPPAALPALPELDPFLRLPLLSGAETFDPRPYFLPAPGAIGIDAPALDFTPAAHELPAADPALLADLGGARPFDAR